MQLLLRASGAECKTWTDRPDQEVAGLRHSNSDPEAAGVDVVVPVLGRFNSVVERKSWGKCLRDFLASLPWALILVTLVQMVVQFSSDRDAIYRLALKSGEIQDHGGGGVPGPVDGAGQVSEVIIGVAGSD